MANLKNRLIKVGKRKIYLIFGMLLAAIVLLTAFWVIPQFSNQVVVPVIGAIQPTNGYYLPYRGNISRIFVVSATLSSGSYPDVSRSAIGGGPIIVKNKEPCVIINVTIRNDYSAQFPPPAKGPNAPNLVWVVFTAEIFSGSNQIKSTDLLQVGLPPDAGASDALSYGETGTLSMYLATTSRTEITGFQIDPDWIGGIPYG